MFYFEQFPKIPYDISGTNDFKLTPDIFRRVKARSKILNNVVLLMTMMYKKVIRLKQ